MGKRKNKRSIAAIRGWETRRANQRKRSNAAKRGWKTRRENERKQKRKRQPQEWHIRYHVKGKPGKRNPFYGEMTFTTSKTVSEDQANHIAAQLFRGESVKGVKFKRFDYGHKHGQVTRTVDDFDDLPDFEFLVYDEEDGYIER